MEMYFKRMKDEWTGLVEQADPLIRAKAAEIAVAHAHYLSIEFYRIVRIDPHAEEFLSNEQVERQLKSAMERWIINVLSAQVDDVERLIQIQHTVAEVHARIGIPVEIVEMGFRVLKKILYPVIFSSDYSAAEKLQVYHFSINSIDIAMEVMTRAFTFSDSSASKEDENYRIFSLLENAEEEKERQIASILSWEIDIIYKILLDSDLAPFLYTLANDGASIINPAVLKEHAADDARGFLAQNTAGSGPFMLKSWQKGQQLVLVPNPHYPGNKPNFKRVSVKIIGESASRRLQLSRGDIDIADALPVDQLNALKQENKVNVAEYPSLRVTYLYLNNSKAPLNQADLRRAISWSTDYQGMVNGILSGNGKQMRGPIPEGMWGYDATAMQYNHDETKAKAEWDKVTSKPTSLTFLYSDNDPNWEPIALATQSSLNKLGINVKLEKLANATMRDRVGKGDYDIAIGNWSPDFADPYMFMNYWFESDKKGLPGNRSFYENSEVDKLLRNALATTDQTQRTRDYQQAQKIVIDDAAYVYLFQKNYQLAMNKEVKGFVFNPMLEQVFNINTMSK
ncbi:bacterial extracellular solute-binding s, 5 Middle family protein [Escherichia coli DEC9A]|nr:ABC transporter substrate-binding protein [Escherichia coli]EHW39983.1 bacterial extracellular solute-binding s, 5 Middle family protein [Escherichia coli DEC9A]